MPPQKNKQKKKKKKKHNIDFGVDLIAFAPTCI
jgi:hypothetical protein